MGRSACSNRMSSNRCSRPRATPTAEMNSDTTTSAPKRRHSSRKGDSDTPDMGARNRGKSCPVWYGKCMRHNVMTRCARSNQPLRFAAVSTGGTRTCACVSSLPKTRSTCSCKARSEEHTSELQSQSNLVCRLLLEKKKKKISHRQSYNIEYT